MKSIFIIIYLWFNVCLCFDELFEPPRIVEHPSDLTVRDNQPATLYCKADGKPKPTIEWYKNGEPLKSGQSSSLIISDTLFFYSVSHGDGKNSDSGTYFCVARNEVGVASSNNATLRIAYLRDNFRNSPKSKLVLSGDSVTIECDPPRGYPEPQISWKKDGKLIHFGGISTNINNNNNGDDPVHQSDITSESYKSSSSFGRYKLSPSGDLRINGVRSSDRGRYSCLASNPMGSRESSPALLTVHVKPYFTRPPENTTALLSSTVELQCKVDGDPVPTVSWIKLNDTLPSAVFTGSQRHQITSDNSLRIRNVTMEDAGSYVCEAENSGGRSLATALLMVHFYPRLHISHTSVDTSINDDVRIGCRVTGSPLPIVFWTHEGWNETIMLINGSYDDNIRITSEGSLIISKVEKANQGHYTCSAVSPIGSVMARTSISVTAITTPPPPIIRLGPTDQVVREESVAMLLCEVAVETPSQVKWLFNEKPLSEEEPFRFLVLDSGTLQIDGVKTADSGLYTCMAQNDNGLTRWTANLTVKSPLEPNIAFYKIHQPNLLPPAPSKPIAVNVTKTSITLRWTYDKLANDIRGFRLEYYSSILPDRWIPIGDLIVDTRHTVTELLPDTTYIFAVRAENDRGLGSPSILSNEISTIDHFDVLHDTELNEARNMLSSMELRLQVPSQPFLSASHRVHQSDPLYLISPSLQSELFHQPVSRPNSTILALELETKNDNPFVESYDIFYRQISPMMNRTYTSVKVPRFGASHMRITGLSPYSEYEVFVTPRYKIVYGRPSNAIRARTPEDVPSLFPENILIKVINSSTASVSWHHLIRHQWNGIPRGYRFRIYSEISGYSNTFNVTPTASSIILNNLTTSEQYFVQIAGYTSAGSGPYSPPALLRVEPGYIYLSDNRNGRFLFPEPNRFRTLTKDPIFFIIGIVIIFIIPFVILFIVARRHLGLKKAVGAYITIQLNKCDELEKRAGGMVVNGLNGTSLTMNSSSSKKSWLPDLNGMKKPLMVGGNLFYTTTGPNSPVKLYQSASIDHHVDTFAPDVTNVGSGKQIYCDRSQRKYAEDDEYYAEVDGHTLVTFGKKDGQGCMVNSATASSIEPYATTNLINNYQQIDSPSPIPTKSHYQSTKIFYHDMMKDDESPTSIQHEQESIGGDTIFPNSVLGLLKKGHTSSSLRSSSSETSGVKSSSRPLIPPSSSNHYEAMPNFKPESFLPNGRMSSLKRNCPQPGTASGEQSPLIRSMNGSFEKHSTNSDQNYDYDDDDDDPIYSKPYLTESSVLNSHVILSDPSVTNHYQRSSLVSLNRPKDKKKNTKSRHKRNYNEHHHHHQNGDSDLIQQQYYHPDEVNSNRTGTRIESFDDDLETASALPYHQGAVSTQYHHQHHQINNSQNTGGSSHLFSNPLSDDCHPHGHHQQIRSNSHSSERNDGENSDDCDIESSIFLSNKKSGGNSRLISTFNGASSPPPTEQIFRFNENSFTIEPTSINSDLQMDDDLSSHSFSREETRSNNRYTDSRRNKTSSSRKNRSGLRNR
ncbi:protein sax-3-like [Brevipalpus obovatus]|uniref:protein sax-3-like n=1 Tax=Brevipalpus obovatus TaxID=246614 RepID=UPI003D9F1575